MRLAWIFLNFLDWRVANCFVYRFQCSCPTSHFLLQNSFKLLLDDRQKNPTSSIFESAAPRFCYLALALTSSLVDLVDCPEDSVLLIPLAVSSPQDSPPLEGQRHRQAEGCSLLCGKTLVYVLALVSCQHSLQKKGSKVNLGMVTLIELCQAAILLVKLAALCTRVRLYEIWRILFADSLALPLVVFVNYYKFWLVSKLGEEFNPSSHYVACENKFAFTYVIHHP